MPRARRRCAKVGCRELQPCPVHPQGWRGYVPKQPLPHGWGRLVRAVRKRDREICQYCGTLAPDGQCDHYIPRSQGGTDSMENLRWACRACHTAKTQRESHKR